MLGVRRGDRHLQYLHAKEAPGTWQSVLGESSAIQRVVAILRQVCVRTFSGGTPTILLNGETGTGKGFIAKCGALGIVPTGRGPQEFAAFIKSEVDTNTTLLRDAGYKPE